MSAKFAGISLSAAFLFVSVGAAVAQGPAMETPVVMPEPAAPATGDRLTIATRHVPPFAMKADDGSWSGIAIDLWEQIAQQKGLQYELVDMGLIEMLDAVSSKQADAAVAALTITSKRESILDFTHPFHTSGLGVAVQYRQAGSIWAVLNRLVSVRFLMLLGALLALLAGTGVLIWLAERRSNTQFQSDPIKGIGSGLWWSAVTMTTVGYGDKAPVTFFGRAIGLVWMFVGVIIISSFTAAFATALTADHFEQRISGPDDLYSARVITVAGSTSESFLDLTKVRHKTVTSVPEAMVQLAAGEADAVVYDVPILQYRIAEEYQGRLKVLPFILQRQDYGFALPQHSPAREAINAALLLAITDEDWPKQLQRYLGKQ